MCSNMLIALALSIKIPSINYPFVPRLLYIYIYAFDVMGYGMASLSCRRESQGEAFETQAG